MKKIHIVFMAVVFACIAIPGILVLALPDREFSENENRYLQVRPKITTEKIFSGDAQSELTDYFSDQFVKRDFWTGTATRVKKSIGYQDVGGVFIGKDHYYFEKLEDADISATRYRQNLSFVQKFLTENEDLSAAAMLVPTPGHILEEKLPKGSQLYDDEGMYALAKQTLKGAEFVDCRDTFMEQKEKEIYYRTDHHWTGYGAYLGYQAYCEAAGLSAREYESFDPVCVSEEFFGTLYSKALDAAAIPDSITLPQNLPEVTVLIGNEEYDSIYDDTKLETKDKYAVFFGGNYGQVTIRTSAGTGRNLLIVKDSFANSMVPYLLEDYDTITMVDLRYFRGSLESLKEEQGITDFLLLYEMSSFAQDGNLYKMTVGN